MVDIARGMGMKTIAEFVEAPETAAMLHEKGVDYSQGYYHGRPRPIADEFGTPPTMPVAELVASTASTDESTVTTAEAAVPTPETAMPTDAMDERPAVSMDDPTITLDESTFSGDALPSVQTWLPPLP